MKPLRDVMTRSIEVIAPEATLQEAAQKMAAYGVGILPVWETSELMGVVTDRDIAVRALAQGIDPSSGRVRDVMTRDVATCFEDQPVEAAARVMVERQIRRIPVLSRTGHLVGIISLDDLPVDIGDARLAGEVLEAVSEKRALGSHPYEHILVALDGSKLGEQVLPHATALAEKFGSTVMLLRAVTPVEAVALAELSVGAMSAGHPASDAVVMSEETRWGTISYLTSLEHNLRAHGLRVTSEHPEGSPAQMIVQRARHLRVDLIAMATHGRGGLGRAILGSVADEVLRSAPCPVLLVKTREDE